MNATVPISMYAFAGLRDGQWINDNIINHVMEGLQIQARVRDGPNADVYMSTYLYFTHSVYGHTATRKLTQPHVVDKGKRMFTLVNTRNMTHWVAVEVFFELKKVTIMDSMRPTKDDMSYRELENIANEFACWSETDAKLIKGGEPGPVGVVACLTDTRDWTFVCCTHCLQQTNTYDCALFALASVAARGKGLTQHTVDDMPHQRRYLAAWIVSLQHHQEGSQYLIGRVK